MYIYRLRDFDRGRLRISLGLQKWEKMDASVEHTHDCVELIHVLKGSGINCIDHRSYPIIAGDLYVINRGSTHWFSSRNELIFYNLMFSFSLFSRSELSQFRADADFNIFFGGAPAGGAGESRMAKLALAPPYSRRLTALFESLRGEIAPPREPGCALNCKAYLTLILNEICRLRRLTFPTDGKGDGKSDGKNDAAEQEPGDGADSAFARILRCINRNYLRDISIEELAQAANLSPHYVGDFFRRRTGVTPIRYIHTLRVERAGALLRSSPELSVSEIAARCGFDDSSYFTRVFRRLTGRTPSDFRDENKLDRIVETHDRVVPLP